MTEQPAKFRVACPEGHTRGLRLRFVADAPIRLVQSRDLRYLEPSLSPSTCVEVQAVESEPVVDGGVWCPFCDAWYAEEDCIQPLDAAARLPS